MTQFAVDPHALKTTLATALGDKARKITVAYSYMQRALGVARASVVQYLGPLYSAAIAWLVLGEHIEVFHGVGAVLILPGIWLSTRR